MRLGRVIRTYEIVPDEFPTLAPSEPEPSQEPVNEPVPVGG